MKVIIKAYKGGKVCVHQQQRKADKLIVLVVMPWLKLND